jgi:hypothetical protein
MMDPCSLLQRQPLRLLIDSSLPQGRSLTSPESTSSSMSDSSLTTSGVTPSTGNPDWFICNVICMFDFESDDPHHLPFSRNEILAVVKMEESGWWAAMRPKGDRLGWIPSSFVERLTEPVTEELDEEVDDTRIHDHEGGNASIPFGDTHSDCIQLEEIFNSVSDAVKVSWQVLSDEYVPLANASSSSRYYLVTSWHVGVFKIWGGAVVFMTLSSAYPMMSHHHTTSLDRPRLLCAICHNPPSLRQVQCSIFRLNHSMHSTCTRQASRASLSIQNALSHPHLIPAVPAASRYLLTTVIHCRVFLLSSTRIIRPLSMPLTVCV